jgi:iron complex transport system permease protein
MSALDLAAADDPAGPGSLPGAGGAGRAVLDRALRRSRTRQATLIGLGLAVLALAALAAVMLGTQTIAPGRVLRALAAGVLPVDLPDGMSRSQVQVIWNLRLPRTVMAIVGGAALAVAGVAMQAITRNPLVSPFTVGISPASAFGASLAILFGAAALPGWGEAATVAAAFVMAIACAGVVIAVSSLRGVSATALILAGVGLTYFFGALTATVQFIATEQQLGAIIQWTFGSLNGTTWTKVAIVAAVLAVVLPVLAGHAWALNAFTAGGDETATALGFPVGRTRVVVTVAAVLATAAFVGFAGVIGFVGLVAPHIARMIIGGDHRVLVPFAAIVGAVLLLVADTVGRVAFAPVIIPVGIVVSYLGVPLFLHLVISRRKDFLP